MKVYFTASIFHKESKGEVYKRIHKKLKQLGHEVLSYGIMNADISNILLQTDEDLTSHYKRVLKWINQSSMLITEASFPSTIHIGHEITLALEKGKPVIVLYQKGYEPFFLSGLDSEKLALVEYTPEDLEIVVENSIEFAKGMSDTRFNFFVAPKHQNYMDWISKNRRIPRAVFLRRLIEEAIDEEGEYEK